MNTTICMHMSIVMSIVTSTFMMEQLIHTSTSTSIPMSMAMSTVTTTRTAVHPTRMITITPVNMAHMTMTIPGMNRKRTHTIIKTRI